MGEITALMGDRLYPDLFAGGRRSPGRDRRHHRGAGLALPGLAGVAQEPAEALHHV